MEVSVSSALPKPPERIVAVEKRVPPHAREVELFARELQPAVKTREKLEILQRVIGEYETGLNDAMSNKNRDKAIHDHARFVVNADKLASPTGSQEDIVNIQAAKQANIKEVFEWFNVHYHGVVALLDEYIDPNGDQPEIRDRMHMLIGENVSHWMRYFGGSEDMRRETQMMQLDVMRRMLLEHVVMKDAVVQRFLAKQLFLESNPFAMSVEKISSSEEFRKWLESDDFADEIDSLILAARTDEAIFRLDPDVHALEIHEWIKATAQDARKGRKIYDTPSYAAMIQELHFLGRKRNGVGGIILYGPPGTGKTEMIQEKNKQEGYNTRVVSIHHYTSFAELLAEKPVQVGGSQGAEIAKNISAVLSVIQQDTPEQFADYFLNMLMQLKSEGKFEPASEKDRIFFLSAFPSLALGDSLAKLGLQNLSGGNINEVKGKLSSEEWRNIRDNFISSQKARLLRTTLPSFYQETFEDVIKGEMLLGMTSGQRVLLDEIDKAGPNSLGGILSFLAKSPGVDYFEYGQMQFPIPRWFKVDATSNSYELDTWLADRFASKKLDTPPVLDQLMIAIVRVSNDRGRILLSNHEQAQLAGFFMYIVPEINKILQEEEFASISNRSIQEFTSYLVDFTNMRRTDRSFKEAVTTLLLQNKMWASNAKVSGKIQEVLKRFDTLLREPEQKELGQAVPRLLRMQPLERIPVLQQRRDESLSETLASSLIHVIKGLAIQRDRIKEPRARKINLRKIQQDTISRYIVGEEKRRKPLADIRDLPTGFTIRESIRRVEGEADYVTLGLIPLGENQLLVSTEISEKGRMTSASADGGVVVLANPEGKEERFKVVYAFEASGKARETQLGYFAKNSLVVVSDNGELVGRLNREDAVFDLSDLRRISTTDVGSIGGVNSFSFSGDGRTILIKSIDGKMSLFSSQNLSQPLEVLEGEHWQFTGSNLVVQVGENASAMPDALLVA